MTDAGGFEFECEITRAINPVSYEEIELTPPVHIESWDQYDLFCESWERFCRDAADKGVSFQLAWFQL